MASGISLNSGLMSETLREAVERSAGAGYVDLWTMQQAVAAAMRQPGAFRKADEPDLTTALQRLGEAVRTAEVEGDHLWCGLAPICRHCGASWQDYQDGYADTCLRDAAAQEHRAVQRMMEPVRQFTYLPPRGYMQRLLDAARGDGAKIVAGSLQQVGSNWSVRTEAPPRPTDAPTVATPLPASALRHRKQPIGLLTLPGVE